MKYSVISLFLCLCLSMSAKVQLPQLFQSGMVVQRGKKVPVWGKADAGQRVTIRFNKFQTVAVADAEGRFSVELPAMKAGGPYTMVVDDLVLTNVMVGDVWLFSGQSNVDVTIERVYPQYVDEINDFNLPDVRLFRVQNETNTHGVQHDIRPTSINWLPLNKQNAWLFSALGSFYGKRMYEKTGVAQGIIVNSWGGTPIEAWVSADSLSRDFPLYVERTRLYQDDAYVRAQAEANRLADQRWNQLLDELDPGIKGNYAALDCDDASWDTVDQYSMEWAKNADGRGIVGSIWLRQHVQLTREQASQPARLYLGTLFDADITYVNGQQVGRTYYQYPPRRYDIPSGLLREGDNVITVRFINKNGIAHFIPEKPYCIAFGDDRFHLPTTSSFHPQPSSFHPQPSSFHPQPSYLSLSPTWLHHAGASMPSCPSGDVSLQNLPSTLYNAVVYPLAPFAISGVVWYQGESNTGRPQPYANLLRKLIGNWRTLWHAPRLPFCIVQLANHDGRQQTGNPMPLTPQTEPVNSGWAQLREAQRQVAVADPHAELAVAIDLGEPVDIHPLRKKEVAERVGLCMDRLVYGQKVSLSPQPKQVRRMGKQVVITFDQSLQEGDQPEFEVAGADRRFVNATATSSGRDVTLDSSVPDPCYVRYAWKDNPPQPLLRSANHLPASPFEMPVGK